LGSIHHLPGTPPQAPVRADAPGAVLLTLRGAIAHADVLGLCAHIEELLRDDDADLVVCDVAEVTDPDCATVDALARMQLTAKRLGAELRLRGASEELHDVLALAGLCDVVGLCGRYASS
jgi:anti-anti-sigma regulatory factor